MAFHLLTETNGRIPSSLISDVISRVKCQYQVVTHQTDSMNNFIRSISDNQQEAEPFYVLDLGVAVRLLDKWNQYLPTVKPFYAVKCNPDPALLFLLASLGTNFDCASRAEIEIVLGLGVNPNRIIYANPCKMVSHIKYAASVGVNLTTFDSKDEIDKIKKWHPKCELLVRIKVDDESSWRSMGNKFGASLDEVVPLLQHAYQAGLKVTGVSFHVGTKASEAKVYRDAISAARYVFDAASELEMPEMHILNIGGGFKDSPLFDEIGRTVNDSVQEYFPNQSSSLKVIAEPGRFFAETAFTMVTNVIGKRARGRQIEYWIDDGTLGSFNLGAYDHSSMMFKPLLRNEDGEAQLSTIFGPTCNSLDIVASECKLPELKVGDVIVFYNMGAYTTSAASKFNGFNRFEMPTYLVYSTPD
ncbi:ornithine decarboxylase-like [Mercurialis annua]|uniref:ornithine decarboxylase-like n=1 Tax=Mercurialis annua TaxID=3986 RepID=UPI0024ACD6FE|nr:ornithine decarboxylase-like [Mercurialis annua]